MLSHLLKLIWKRKSRNVMLTLELLLAFIVVFAIAAFGVRYAQLYRLPLGFDYRDLWSVTINPNGDRPDKPDLAVYEQLRRAARALPAVDNVAFASYAPFELSSMTNRFSRPDGNGNVSSSMLEVSDDFFAVNRMRLAEGAWFSDADAGAVLPVVINRALARQLFPGRSSIGQRFTDSEKSDAVQRTLKVTGMIDDYRNQGEFMTPGNFMLIRHAAQTSDRAPGSMLLRLKPGTARAFESTLNRQLKMVRGDWSYTISPAADQRASMLKLQTAPLQVLSVIAAFLLAMVAFGLFGVLWQNTTRRIPEIGLRRALGADAGSIYRQIVGEQLLLSTAAMLLGLLLLVQLPLTDALGPSLNWTVFGVAAALSAGVIYLLSLLCALYPGWRAARLSPTQALHYE